MATVNREGPGRRVTRPSKFSADLINALIKDLQEKRLPLGKITITDEETPGLRAIIRDSGTVTLSLQYAVTGQKLRPTISLGEFPEMSIQKARNYSKTILELGKQGIDIQQGLLPRLLKELERDGVKWRPK